MTKPCKHNYKPRYSREYQTPFAEALKETNGDLDFKSGDNDPYCCKETYVHDICVKCGDIKK